MYVCHCNVVTDRTVRGAIAAGARSVEAVAAACGAGGDCAGCVPAIEDLIQDARLALAAPEHLRRLQELRRRPTRLAPAT